MLCAFTLVSLGQDLSALPPDLRAFREASRTVEAARRIEALESFIAEYPYSPGVATARDRIIDAALESWPSEKRRLLAQAKRLIAAAPPEEKPRVELLAARKFAEAGVLLRQSQAFAQSALRSAIGDRERAESMGVLGRALLARGKTREAEEMLTEALKLNPDLREAAIALGEAKLARKQYAEAVEALALAKLSGKFSPKANARLLEAWTGARGGSAAKLDEKLDSMYRERFPSPVTPNRYQPTGLRTRRVVLAEVFTGAGCPPCAASSLAFDAALERYSRDELAVLMYHVHIPVMDPLTSPETKPRVAYYSVVSAPTMAIDGQKLIGGGPREFAPKALDRLVAAVDRRLEVKEGATIDLSVSRTGNRVVVRAKPSRTAQPARLRIALVDRLQSYSGENGTRFHPMVVRSIAEFPASDAEHSFDVDAIAMKLKAYLDRYEVEPERGSPGAFQEKKFSLNAGALAVVAFLQDDRDQRVLNSVYRDVPAQ